MKYLKKIFESSDMDEIKEVFTDIDFEEKGMEITYDVEPNGVQVSINKMVTINRDHQITNDVVKSKIEQVLMSKEEYIEIHDLVMSKITYLDEVEIRCVNVIYAMMTTNELYETSYESLADYLSENESLADLLNFLYKDNKKICMIMLYFRFR